MTVSTGVLVLLAYATIMILVALKGFKKANSSKVEFLLAGRRSHWLQSSFSIAATWVWAPALFVSAQKAYTHGLTGWLWFFVPNVLTLLVFGVLAFKLYDKFPKGYTLPQFMKNTYSPRVHKVYMVQFVVLQICSFAVQLLAGAAAASFLTGIPYAVVVIVLAAVALSYSMLSGLRASLITDGVQMVLMIIIGLVGAWLTVGKFGGTAVVKGFGGVNGNLANPLSADGLFVAVSWGIAVTVGLFAGPFGDQTFWQRVFSQPKQQVKKSFIGAAVAFSIIPITFGILGFAAAGAGLSIKDVGMVNVEVISLLGRPVVTTLVFGALLAGLGSTMDSNLSAIASLFVVDMKDEQDDKKAIAESRMAMVALAVAGVALALVPGMKISLLFLFYGTLRASTLFPTGLTIHKTRNESSMFWGILIGLVVGAPLFVIGSFVGLWWVSLIGNLIAVGIPASLVYFRK